MVCEWRLKWIFHLIFCIGAIPVDHINNNNNNNHFVSKSASRSDNLPGDGNKCICWAFVKEPIKNVVIAVWQWTVSDERVRPLPKCVLCGSCSAVTQLASFRIIMIIIWKLLKSMLDYASRWGRMNCLELFGRPIKFAGVKRPMLWIDCRFGWRVRGRFTTVKIIRF